MTAPQDPHGFDAPQYGAPPPAYGAQPFGGAQLADWGTRVVGALIDGVIIAVAYFVLSAVSSPLGRLAQLVAFVGFGYLVGTTGQTPGKQVMKIKVLREADGQLLGAGAGIGRAFLHILDSLSCLVGYLWPLWDAKKQTFADKIIKSVVVKV